MTSAEPIGLPIREWLELGQVMNDMSRIGPKYFRPWHTGTIGIGEGCKVKADGKTYSSGRYYLRYQ